MPSPFPGMDPFVEHPSLWPDVHNALIATIRADLAPLLRPRYVARLQERTYELDDADAVWIADVAVHRAAQRMAEPRTLGPGVVMAVVPMPEQVRETFLEVRVAGREEEVVTLVEILSPTNKRPGSDGRARYEKQRRAVFGSGTHLVEIDLCRAGPPMPLKGDLPASDYRVLVSRADARPRADLLPFSVRDPLPHFRLPLRAGDAEPWVDLKSALARVYEDAALDLSIDYRGEPVPPLPAAETAWCRELLAGPAGSPPRG